MLHILINRLLHNSLLDLPLRVDVKWIGIQYFNLPLFRDFCLLLSIAGLPKQLSESSWIRLNRFSQFWIRLRNKKKVKLSESSVDTGKMTKLVEVEREVEDCPTFAVSSSLHPAVSTCKLFHHKRKLDHTGARRAHRPPTTATFRLRDNRTSVDESPSCAIVALGFVSSLP